MSNEKLSNEELNPALNKGAVIGSLTINATVSHSIGMGIEKYHKECDCELILFKGRGEDWIEVTVKGTEENLKKMNELAKQYKPTVVRSKDCR